MGNNVPQAIANMNRNELNDLIAECTCPICQDLFEAPLRLECTHTFCQKCLNRLRREHPELPPLARMLLLSMDSDEQANCPICRKGIDFDKATKDENAIANINRLSEVKKYCCQEENCWNRVQDVCKLCKQRFCEDHDEKKHETLRKEASELRKQLSAFVRNETENEELSQLMLQRENIQEIILSLKQMVEQAMLQFDHQLARSMREIEANSEKGQRNRVLLQEDLKQLEQWLDTNDLPQMQAKVQPMRSRLQQSQRDNPARAASQQLSVEGISNALAGVFSQLEPRTFVDAYKHVESKIKPISNLKTKHEVWDMQILTNTAGLTVEKKVVRLRHGAKQIKAPCLVVNFKGFPTGSLHLTDMEGAEFASIEMEFRGNGMVGRFNISNQHQLLFASDAGRHIINVCSLDGRVLRTFGEEGTGVGQLTQPLGMCMHAGLLYVTDSENRRLQIYDADENYRHVGCVQHEKFSTNICDVSVSDQFIVVLDGNKSSLTVFNTASYQFVRREQLEADGFQLTTDRFGNIFVSLPSIASFQVFNPDCSVNIKTFSLEDPMYVEGIRRLNGLALEHGTGRLFFADTFREIIHVLQT